jgi:hypothetical protein
MKTVMTWVTGVSATVVAGLILFHLTGGRPDAPSPPPEVTVQPQCEPLPPHLSELKCMPDGFPGAVVPLHLEFAAVGPDPDGRIREYRWDYNGQTKTGRRVEYTLVNRGANIVSLSVTDLSGCTVHRQCRILAK